MLAGKQGMPNRLSVLRLWRTGCRDQSLWHFSAGRLRMKERPVQLLLREVLEDWE